MRLSEQILLGRHLVEKPSASDLNACALGMGMKAEGIATEHRGQPNYRGLVRRWPWLLDDYQEKPCRCITVLDVDDDIKSETYCAAIAHLFDRHIIGTAPSWTLEQLVDYVRSVEPEEAPEQAEVFAETEKIAAGDTRRQG
jgi:hypothetical protein